MAYETINIGTAADDRTGDTPRTAWAKVVRMLTDLYAATDTAVTDARTTVLIEDALASYQAQGPSTTLIWGSQEISWG